MKEIFLHHIWESLKFTTSNLFTQNGQTVSVIFPGERNMDQGPDFLNAHVEIDGHEWFGHVEIHIHSEDWYRHGHDEDPFYNPVVLHVVYESHRKPIVREDGTAIPEISLEGLIKEENLSRQEQLLCAARPIPCGPHLAEVPDIIIGQWLDRMGVERMQMKVLAASQRLKENVQDWEQVLWEEVAGKVGGPVNKEAFVELAKLVPFKVLRKYMNCRLKLEAILYGAAGLLSGSHKGGRYQQYLSAEWGYLSYKHELGIIRVPLKRLRMRPISFPSIRISQLADLIFQFPNLLDLLLKGGVESFMKKNIRASIYWETHYGFDEEGKPGIKCLGKTLKNLIVMNILIPFGFLYNQSHGRQESGAMMMEELEKLRPENNRIIRLFMDWGVRPANALRSQGMVRLKKTLCDQKKCLNCALGIKIIKGIDTWKHIRS